MRTVGLRFRLLTIALVMALLVPVQSVEAASAPTQAASAISRSTAVLTVGSTAVVRADGECVRFREGPSLASRQLTCLREGTLVTVLGGRIQADGYWWQRIQWGALSGWAADNFLVESKDAAAAPASCLATSATIPPAVVTPRIPTLSGGLPQAGGFGMAVWSGGLTSAIATAAEAGGCHLSAVWVSQDDGGLLGFVFGAPDIVNRAWLDRFPGDVPGGTPVITACGGPSSSAVILSNLDVIVPAPWGIAPISVRSMVPPATSARSVVVLDGASGTVMYQKEGRTALPPASLTKIVTTVLAVERGNLDDWVQVEVDGAHLQRTTDSTIMGLRPGDCFRVRDLLYGTMLPSGNDAALAVGRYEGGSDAAFVAQMNSLLNRLGLRDSRFKNPHGLSEDGHVASAYDLAMLTRYAMTLPDFVTIVGAKQWQAQGSRTIPLRNVNAFLSSYPGADGVKTGFTEEAGRTLVASVTRNGRRVYVAVMNATEREHDAQVLFDWAFANFIWP